MLEAAPLLERMHHAQMLLWLAEKWTPAQRRTYFQSLADAVAFSKGGYRYADFWRRIREAAREHTPADQRAALADIIAPPIAETTGAGGIQPQGPGRTWTVDAAAEIAGTRLTGRDFTRGKGLFTTVGCAGCHRLAGEGGLIGPDLTGVGQRFTTRDLLEAIIEPSRSISDQYRMVMIQTKDGHSYSGRILSRDADSTRIATNLMRPSQTTSVSQDVIVSERALPVSVMPSGLVDALNEDELLDLVAFVTSGGDEHHRVFAPLK
jgi:putative heme-binding domain-containing protein